MREDGEWEAYPGGGNHTVVGDLRRYRAVMGPGARRRDLLVLLPPSYARSTRRYPVLYMQDGQNLFDAATSYAGEWRVDETMTTLSAEGIEAIIVGLPHAEMARSAEYGVFADAHNDEHSEAEAYLAFLIQTVKPLVDASFRTKAARQYTGIMGSSLGGLISLYAFFSRPTVFGFAGAMSPSLWWAGGAIFHYVESAGYLPGRLYLDVGGQEQPGNPQRTMAEVQRLATLLRRKGYDERLLRVVVEPWGGHNEEAWARRLPTALRFLLTGL